MTMAVQIRDKEAKILQLLQFVFHNISVLTPAKIDKRAEDLGVKKCVVSYFIDESKIISHGVVGEVHVYEWLPRHKDSGKTLVIPNVYMVRAMLNEIKSKNMVEAERRNNTKEQIRKLGKPEYKGKTYFKVEKFATYMRDMSTDWSRTKLIRPAEVYRELKLTDMTLTTMIKMGILFKRGDGVNTEYKWNEAVELTPAIVKHIVDQRKVYAVDKEAVMPFAPALSGAKNELPVEKHTVGNKTEADSASIILSNDLPSNGKFYQKDIQLRLKPADEAEIRSMIKSERKNRKGEKHFMWTDSEMWAVKMGLAENMDYKDIAKVLGRSAGAVSGKIHWMRKQGMLENNSLGTHRKLDAFPTTKISNDQVLPKKRQPGLLKRIWNAILNK